jgi:hypothetical protein
MKDALARHIALRNFVEVAFCHRPDALCRVDLDARSWLRRLLFGAG